MYPTIDIDECSFDVCQNGGTCTNRFGNYKCNCMVGFNGKSCEHGEYINKTIPIFEDGDNLILTTHTYDINIKSSYIKLLLC